MSKSDQSKPVDPRLVKFNELRQQVDTIVARARELETEYTALNGPTEQAKRQFLRAFDRSDLPRWQELMQKHQLWQATFAPFFGVHHIATDQVLRTKHAAGIVRDALLLKLEQLSAQVEVFRSSHSQALSAAGIHADGTPEPEHPALEPIQKQIEEIREAVNSLESVDPATYNPWRHADLLQEIQQ